MAKILVIDDEKAIRNSLKDILEYEKHDVTLVEDGEQGLIELENDEYEIVLCDIKMPGMDGIEVLEKAIDNGVSARFIMISGHGTVDTAVGAIKKGAFDFIEKPLDLNRLLITVKNGLEIGKLETETKVLKKRVSKKYKIVGESKILQDIKEMVDFVERPEEYAIEKYEENATTDYENFY